MDSSIFTEFFRAILRSPKLRRPSVVVIASAFFIILAEYLTHVRWTTSPALAYAVYWFFVLSACALLSIIELKDMRRSEDRAVVSVMIGAATVGLSAATAKIFFYWQLWTVFNIVAEPMRTALVALIIAWMFAVRERATPRAQGI